MQAETATATKIIARKHINRGVLFTLLSNDPDSIAIAQVESWMNSLGHRGNILNSRYNKIGVGVAYDGHYYISTQDFY